MIRSLVKKVIGSVSPKTLEVLRAIHCRLRSARAEQRNGAAAVARKVADAAGLEVHAGPFCGMRFPEVLRNRAIGPKLLGTYEQELHGFVASAISASPERIIIVGSAEGYYAVGLACAVPGAEVIAYDIDPWARARCAEMARLNGVGARVETRSFCGPEDLLALRGVRAMVVSDCEGFEYRLFTPEVISALGKCSVIIETHPHVNRDDNAALARAFEGTHTVQTITFDPGARHRAEKFAPVLSDEEFARAANEYRVPAQQWLCVTPTEQAH